MDTALKEGYLLKRGHNVKNWKDRWFILTPTTLSYYKNPKVLRKKSEGSANLTNRTRNP